MQSSFKLFLLWAAVHCVGVSAAPVPSSNLAWGPCTDLEVPAASSALLCSNLQVPLDYTDSGAGNLTLNLIKLPASTQPSKGSILYNPGGPGDGGRTAIAELGTWLSAMLDGEFDIISWDPRGTGKTLPYSCFDSQGARLSYQSGVPFASNASNSALTAVWNARKSLAEACSIKGKPFGELVGTAFTARDMMQIVDALNEDGLLRYWGQSYGTILGMTAAAMFPERMDRLVIDGVVNPHDYYQIGLGSFDLADTDAVFAGFFAACMASPKLCPLATLGTQDVSLSQQVYQLIDRLRDDPPITNSSVPYVDYYGLLKELVLTSLYNPVSDWEALSFVLSYGLTDLDSLVAYAGEELSKPNATAYAQDEATYGILCSDTSFRTNDLAQVTPLIEASYAQSVLAGDLWDAYELTCAQWPFVAKERVKTDWNIATRHPALFVGNTFDPVTPLASARNASAGFVGSEVLVQNGYGHASVAQPSKCTAHYIKSYFVHGAMPSPGTICQVDVDGFTNQTFLSGLGQHEGKNKTRRSTSIDSSNRRGNGLLEIFAQSSRRMKARVV
ncbi:alpha/beta-hydrolase [Myriangium duriaei CBS 260.36]|uniref:Alpha/beta-hydrolase n=1 Tax=Myriangium duriaei CBS 260.36 TaxID=1168546 RepID=A0A9P4MQA6_9PEZI|nr:alpha/beta-hydrolase [Myriangium duriaei CBS 260.36]